MIKKRGISFLLAVVTLLSMCATSLRALAVQPESVNTATLTINYYLEGSSGNMIHEPYIAQQVVASTYEVKSPEIENFKLVDDGQATISGTLTYDSTIEVYYTYEEQTSPYTVVYEGFNPVTTQTVELDRITGYAPEGTKVPVEYKEFFGYDKDSGDDMSLMVTADGNATKTLRYTLKDEPYIIFRTQGSYVAPISEAAETDISEQIEAITEPTREGYIFQGWEYDGAVYETAAELANELSTMPPVLTYVNAVWEPGEANYTVLTWFQNAEDDGYTLYANQETRSGTVGEPVTATLEDKAKGENDEDAVGNAYYGFNYSRCEDTTIAADGSAVLNLYFDREIWKIHFMEEDNETVWKTIEGKYMSLIGDKLPTQEELKEHYGPSFAYMAKTEGDNDSAMLEKFENSKIGGAGHGEQNVFPYFNPDMYEYQIRHFSYDPNADSTEQLMLIRTSYIYYEKQYAPGMRLFPPEGFTWSGGWWKTAPSEAGLETAKEKENPQGTGQDEEATFYNVWQYMDIYIERIKSTLEYVSNGTAIQTTQNVPYEKNVDLSVVPDNGEDHMQFEGWYTDPSLMDSTEPLEECQMPASDLTLYAKWAPVDYTVTFNSQEGTEVPSQQVAYNTAATEPQAPTRPGYAFTGWYTEPNGGDIWTFERTIEGDTTLYAHWRETNTAPFTVKHIIDGEEEPFYQEEGSSTVGDTIYATALSPQDENYPENVYLEPQAASQSITLAEAGGNIITFTYNRIGTRDYTVSYLEQGTEMQLAPSKKVEDTLNTMVTEIPKEIAGYTCTDTDGYKTVSLTTDGENHIIFYYERNGEPIPDQITIYPEDQTIYTGGESGDTNNPEFPIPIYLKEDSDGTCSELGDMTFILDQDSNAVYTADQLFEVKYYNKDGTEITSDRTYGDFTARIVLQDAYQSAFVTTEDGKTVRFGDGTLRIRYVSSFTEASQNLLTSAAVKYNTEEEKTKRMAEVEQDGKAGVLLPENTTIYLNGKTQYDYPEGATEYIALFFDELLPEQADGDNTTYTNMLIAHAASKGYTVDSQCSQFRYLDLVDTYNSNAWVSSSRGSDVFWPYPSGTNKDTEFQLLHFTGLHREYRMNGVSLADQVKASEIETVTYTKVDTGIWFHIGESGFSPFVLAWEESSGGNVPNPGPGTDPDPDVPDPTPDPNPNPDTPDQPETPNDPDIPQTGDPGMTGLWALLSAGSLTGLFLLGKKKMFYHGKHIRK